MQPSVYVVDDDARVGRALCRVLGAHGRRAIQYESAEKFLAEADILGKCACVIVDLLLPCMDGLALQAALGRDVPIIFLTGHPDVPSAVRALAAGAVDFLVKPVDESVLLAAVDRAMSKADEATRRREELKILRARLDRLTKREHEVMLLVAEGLMNKQVANLLGTVEKTIKVHRARVMQKLEVDSLPALVRAVDRLNLDETAQSPPPPVVKPVQP